MSRVAVLGLGAMGSRIAGRLLAAGHEVVVWNRTPAAADGLVDAGAMRSASPAEAAWQTDVVIAMGRDDDAARRIWLDPIDGALAALRPAAVAIDCSTISIGAIRALHDAAAARGTPFLEAPVVGTRPHAESGRLIVLAGGDAAVLDAQRELLAAFAGSVHHLGGPGAGITAKLMVNTLYATQVALLAELIALARQQDVDAARAVEALAETPACSPAAAAAARAMLDRQWAPQFPIELVAKDLGLALDAGSVVPVTAAVAGVFDDAMRAGHGASNITGMIQRYAP